MDHSLLDLIGNTPLVRLRRMAPAGGATVLLKMESANPSGSLKDRIVARIIADAEADGSLQPHHVITDASSGNTGIALAMIAAVKGYRSRIYMPETKSMERRQIMRAWGTDLVLTTGEDQNSHIWAVQEAARDRERFFYLNQNGSPGNWLAHQDGTGEELLRQTGGRMDCFIAGAGTGGVLMGVARRMREAGVGAAMLAVEPDNPHSHIEGLLHFDGSFTPDIWDESLVDRHVPVPDEAAFSTARRLAHEEGLFCGCSTGATVWAALEEARRRGPDEVVVAIAGDRGERYLSTGLFGTP